mgnify:CR=1 FL=1
MALDMMGALPLGEPELIWEGKAIGTTVTISKLPDYNWFLAYIVTDVQNLNSGGYFILGQGPTLVRDFQREGRPGRINIIISGDKLTVTNCYYVSQYGNGYTAQTTGCMVITKLYGLRWGG